VISANGVNPLLVREMFIIFFGICSYEAGDGTKKVLKIIKKINTIFGRNFS
jgi:hypothetical protein